MVDRIRQLLQARQLSPTQFADTIGVARPIVSHILGGRNKPSLEVVQKIIAAFPDVALPWLLSGQGEMLTANASDSPVAAAPPAPEEATVPRPARRPARSAEAAVKPLPAPTPPATIGSPAADVPTPPPAPPVEPAAEAPPRPVAPRPALDAAIGPLLATSPKSIRRVLIFYSDGTFTDFSPSADVL